MSEQDLAADARDRTWLTRYYGVRASFSVAWVAAAFAAGGSPSPAGNVLLATYPAWDAAANVYDAARSGGLRANPTQAFNAIVSTIVALVVAVSLATQPWPVFYALGAWASLAGILQLATGLRRWKGLAAQWPMVLSGAQSAYAGIHFIQRGLTGVVPTPVHVAPYAAFGAFYFAISAGILGVSILRWRSGTVAVR